MGLCLRKYIIITVDIIHTTIITDIMHIESTGTVIGITIKRAVFRRVSANAEWWDHLLVLKQNQYQRTGDLMVVRSVLFTGTAIYSGFDNQGTDLASPLRSQVPAHGRCRGYRYPQPELL